MVETKLVQVHNCTKSELLEDVKNIFENELNELKDNINSSKQTQLLNRKQCAAYFSVSPVTIDSWCTKKILKPYRTGNRKYFKLNELEEALIKIEK